MAKKLPHVTTAYAMAVCEGDILAGERVRKACARHLEDLKTGHLRGLHFDEDAANKVFKFFGELKHGKGRAAGKPFVLSDWQYFVIGSLFGWKREDGKRRFRSAYMEVARKNGKSTLLGGLALYMLGFDGEAAPEVYSAATKRDQAKIVFAEARRMARQHPVLRKWFDVRENVIKHVPSDGEFKPLSSDAQTQDGLNPHFNAVDELHAHKTRDLMDVLESAEGSRDQPMTVIITTAGSSSDKNAVCWERRSYGEAVLNGTFQDDAEFVYIACLDEGDDWRDESVWIKANPNLGISVTVDVLRRARDAALLKPAKQSEFRRKRCNQWLEVADRWISPELWEVCRIPLDLRAVEGRRPIATLDLSSKTDITAVTLTWGGIEEDEPWRFLNRYFCPEKGITSRADIDQVPYLQWSEAGHIIATPGARVDHETVIEEILRLRDLYGFEVFGLDPWNAGGVEARLQKEGLELYEFRQGLKSYSNASKEFEALILAGLISHDGNPVTDWMVGNVSVRVDVNENYMPYKSDQRLRVDGVMTMVMGVGMVLAGLDQKTGTAKRVTVSDSFYEHA